jgi:hypothetical protein
MLSDNAARFYRIAAAVESTIGDRLRNQTEKLVGIDATALLNQLNGQSKYPEVTPDLGDFAYALNILTGDDNVAGGVLDLAGDLLGIFKDPTRILEALGDIAGDLAKLIPAIAMFVEHQISVAISMVSAVGDIASPRTPQKLREDLNAAFGAYFYDDGYVPIDGQPIARPDIAALTYTGGLQVFAKRKTAEVFVRDLVTITVDASADSMLRLRDRHAQFMRAYANNQKARRWMAGLPALSESSVTSAFEEAGNGIGWFQTNPIIGASIGTFAGTAARKATQDVFLRELNF